MNRNRRKHRPLRLLLSLARRLATAVLVSIGAGFVVVLACLGWSAATAPARAYVHNDRWRNDDEQRDRARQRR